MACEQGYKRVMAHPAEARNDPSDITELHYAMLNRADGCGAGSQTTVQAVRSLLANEPGMVCAKDSKGGNGRQPLHYLFKYVETGGNHDDQIKQVGMTAARSQQLSRAAPSQDIHFLVECEYGVSNGSQGQAQAKAETVEFVLLFVAQQVLSLLSTRVNHPVCLARRSAFCPSLEF